MVDSSKSGPVPRYYQLMEFIRERIRSGEWLPDMAIPSERELCERHGVSRMTARQSITVLVNEGLLYREQGKGTFVGRPKIPQQLLSLTGFTEDIRGRKQRPGARVLEAGMWNADKITAERLRIKPGRPVFRLRRVRLADAEPIAIEDATICFIGCERLLDFDLEHDSLYRVLTEEFDMPPLVAEQEIEADTARGEEARLLEIEPDSPVLRTRRITTTHRGQPMEYASAIYRGDKYRFYTRLVRDHDRSG